MAINHLLVLGWSSKFVSVVKSHRIRSGTWEAAIIFFLSWGWVNPVKQATCCTYETNSLAPRWCYMMLLLGGWTTLKNSGQIDFPRDRVTTIKKMKPRPSYESNKHSLWNNNLRVLGPLFSITAPLLPHTRPSSVSNSKIWKSCNDSRFWKKTHFGIFLGSSHFS